MAARAARHAGVPGRRAGAARSRARLGVGVAGAAPRARASSAGAHGGRAVRGPRRGRLAALLREGGESRCRTSRQVSLRVPGRRLHLRPLAAPHGRGECQHGAPVHDSAARVLPRLQAVERGASRSSALAGARRVGRAAARRRLRRGVVEGGIPRRDAARGGPGARAGADRGAPRARVRPLRRRRRGSRAGVSDRPGVGAPLDRAVQRAAPRTDRVRGPVLDHRSRGGDAGRRVDGGAVRLPARVRVGHVRRPAPDCLHQLAHPRPAAAPDRADSRGRAAAAPPLPLSTQPAAQGVRQRPRVARRDAGSHNQRKPGRLLRVVPRLPLLSRLRGARAALRERPLARGPIALFRISDGSQAAPRRAAAAHRRIRRPVVARRVASRPGRDGPWRA